MSKIWEGRTGGSVSKEADDFNSSISFDIRMVKYDISGSIAHAAMLGKQKIITPDDADKLCACLGQIAADLESGSLFPDMECEDVHTFIESELTKRLGDLGKKLHTARSRNDQVALDLRMYLRERTDEITGEIKELIGVITEKAELYKNTVMPGYTHLQRAQPITFGHHLIAYAMMLLRDVERLGQIRRRINVSPIGCGALAGVTFDTDRHFEAEKLGFEGICANSEDGVSDRDFVLELLFALSLVMMHLSRFSEEIILWASWEFKFIEISDDYTTGSSMMPQKKNPDMAELVRGKTGRVYGDLIALFVTMKGLPLAYNKDMQEDKEGVFDACDTVKQCLCVFTGMLSKIKANPENMKKAAGEGFINATDLADYLVGKGLPFREAYKISGKTVALCIKENETLETLPLSKYKEICEAIDSDVYDAIDLETCVGRRISEGGPSPSSVEAQIRLIKNKLNGR